MTVKSYHEPPGGAPKTSQRDKPTKGERDISLVVPQEVCQVPLQVTDTSGARKTCSDKKGL